MMKDIYLSGIGLISSLGHDMSAWRKLFRNEQNPAKRQYLLNNNIEIEYPVFPIGEDELAYLKEKLFTEFGIREDDIEQFLLEDKDFLLLLIASLAGLRNANINCMDKTVALVIAHENLGVNHLIDGLIQKPNLLDPSSPLESFQQYKHDFFRLQNFNFLYHLAKILKVNGPTYTINNACASGLYALELGSNLIKSEQADVVIVVSSDYAHVTEYLWLNEKGFNASNNVIAPFDQKATGSVLGDGAGVIILESEDSLTQRKHSPLGRYITTAFQQDHWRISLPDVTAKSYSKVIKKALSRYGRNVDFIIPHGTGIPMWDKYEAREITSSFKDLNLEIPHVAAFKGFIGHTLGANSLIELVLGIFSLNEDVIPPFFPPDFHAHPSVALPFTQKKITKKMNSVLKTVAAYGGFNAATIIEKT
ncbi:3-oxoacyl-(acyl-carrier-protein) synthase [Fictibacillus solisalsi]|uniref:3-oxoacyl-(Acyl-carrier-protein) synthase n=1 Tax=Fictibacillus solisalsi TaxID=459525 RepID=A0A1H0BPV6_9BACL|nr:beta-ketoacyl synthase N-terminal-like domain-containing protein [Fictibacillus solisalsi]SDN47654.1 3-oxoacyl-(acyl-carrier-protein) synthase [Fictibacillus solisalsi]